MNPIYAMRDDEDDTLLFDQLQQYVLSHYPNPDRIGCLDDATLASLVYAPESLDLADDKFLHIFKCAECTRVLMTYRQERETRAKLLSSRTKPGSRGFRNIYAGSGMTILTLLCCLSLA